MKIIPLALILLGLFFTSCMEEDCPDGMVKCTLRDGTKVCVPKGKC